MKKLSIRGMALMASVAIGLTIVLLPSTAVAASTRAEYIAQADPICQSFGPESRKAQATYNRNYKNWARRLTKGSLKGWINQTHRTAVALEHLVQVHASLTDQLALVAPVPEDAGVINQWLDGRNRGEVLAHTAAFAFDAFKFKRFDRKISQAQQAENTGVHAIGGFGFQVCGMGGV